MKKIIGLLFIIVIVLSFINQKQSKQELRGVYVSYIEISKYLKDKEEIKSKEEIVNILQNIKKLKLNTIILQVRPSMDAIYKSNVFPLSKYLSSTNSYPYDVLSYFLEEAHKENIKVIVWINPYRILTMGTKDDIPNNNPTYKYKDTNIVYEKNGVYLNPAREETNDLILQGVKELLTYPIDGILMDDYFYPDMEIDQKEYEEKNKGETLEEFHLEIINDMVKKVHKECKKKKVLFGISPEGNIENNYQKQGADVKKWLKEKDYVDFIMPQIYYGFENEIKPFIETSNEWNQMIQNDIPLYPALAFYKTGIKDQYAKKGEDEWMNHHDIIEKQIIHIRSLNHYQGFILYRYDYLFGENLTDSNKKEIKNLIKLLNREQNI